MFCSNCGTQVPDNSLRCTNCGTSMSGGGAAANAAMQAVVQSSAVKGFFILIASYFTMPIKTFKVTGQLLREVGSAGAFGVEGTTVPHLSWLRAAGNLFACIAMIGIVLWNVGKAIPSMDELRYQTGSAVGALVWRPLLGVILAIAADWAIMIWLEMLGLWVGISNDIRKMAGK